MQQSVMRNEIPNPHLYVSLQGVPLVPVKTAAPSCFTYVTPAQPVGKGYVILFGTPLVRLS